MPSSLFVVTALPTLDVDCARQPSRSAISVEVDDCGLDEDSEDVGAD